MRTKTSFDEILEPLPVYADDVGMVNPEPVDTLHLPDVRRLAREVGELPALAPWTHPDSRPEPPRGSVRSQRLSTTFVRMIEVDASRLRSLPEWWRTRAGGEPLRPTRRVSLDAPVLTPGNCWRGQGMLRPMLHATTVPVVLTLWPHIEGWTRLTLDPQRRVAASALYFNPGHRALDVFTHWLVTEL